MDAPAGIGMRALAMPLLVCCAHTLTAEAAHGGRPSTHALEISSYSASFEPAVSIRSPETGAVVAGEIAVYAETGGASAVTGVQFLLHAAGLGAVNLGVEDTSPPYAITWDTAAVGDGTHALSALARDTGGRTSYARPVTVTVANGAATPPRGTRIEETDSAIVWGDDWITDSVYGTWSGGSANYNAGPGAFAVFTFNGTGFSWIGYRGRYGGIVKVYIDGALSAVVDTYKPEEEFAVPVYTMTGLGAGAHSMLIELTGLKNGAALNSETAVDAFDVMP